MRDDFILFLFMITNVAWIAWSYRHLLGHPEKVEK